MSGSDHLFRDLLSIGAGNAHVASEGLRRFAQFANSVPNADTQYVKVENGGLIGPGSAAGQFGQGAATNYFGQGATAGHFGQGAGMGQAGQPGGLDYGSGSFGGGSVRPGGSSGSEPGH